MAITEDIADIYNRVNSQDKQLANIAGQLETLIKTQKEYVSLVKMLTKFLFIITMMSLTALIFGAVGEKGLFSVRTIVSTLRDSDPIESNPTFSLTHFEQTTMEG